MVLVFSILLIIISLSACSDSSSSSGSQGTITQDGKDLNLSFSAPRFLAAALITGLECYATLNDGTHHPLAVDPLTNAVSGTIKKVDPGTYVLGVTYFKFSSGHNITLCTYSTSITVIANQTTTVTILDTEMNRNHDDDQDGYTNLAEIRIGTDALDSNDFPAGESPLVSCGNGTTNQVSSADYTASVVVGSSVAGSSSSTDYRLIITHTGW